MQASMTVKIILEDAQKAGVSFESIAFAAQLEVLKKSDPLIAEAIINELRAQRSHLKMIASENFCSLPVQLAMGNWLTDKYAEGIPYRRFYAGCENIDFIEQRGVDLCKKIFGCEHAYVQPHSGIDANLVAFWAILLARVQSKEVEAFQKKSVDEFTPEEYEKVRQKLVNQKLMGMSLNSGGHLTHGYRHNVSSKFFQSIPYEVDPLSQCIDYHHLRVEVKRHKPLVLLAGYSAYPRRINFAVMREIADEVGAVLMVDMAHFSGLVAGKVMIGEENPIPYAHIVTSTTHKTLRGPRGGIVLCNQEFKEAVDKGCPLVMGGPLPHVMAAKAIAFEEASTVDFQVYAAQIVTNCRALAEEMMSLGMKLTTNGTDNHLLVLDVMGSFGLNGRQAESLLRSLGVTLNRNSIPYDPMGPWYASGVRAGTAALTTLGMKEVHMKQIARIYHAILSNAKLETGNPDPRKAGVYVEPQIAERIKKEVQELLSDFPLYPEIQLD